MLLGSLPPNICCDDVTACGEGRYEGQTYRCQGEAEMEDVEYEQNPVRTVRFHARSRLWLITHMKYTSPSMRDYVSACWKGCTEKARTTPQHDRCQRPATGSREVQGWASRAKSECNPGHDNEDEVGDDEAGSRHTDNYAAHGQTRKVTARQDRRLTSVYASVVLLRK